MQLIARVAAASLLSFALTPLATAEETRLLPVPGHLELDTVPTAMRLALPWVGYGEAPVPPEAVAARGDLGEVDRLIAALLLALRDGTALPDLALAQGGNDVTLQSVEDVVALWRQAFGGFETARMIGRSPLGALDLVFWQVDTPRGPFLRAFALETGAEVLRADLTSSARPVATLALNALGASASPAPAAKGEATLPLSLLGSAMSLPLRHAGRRVDFEAMRMPPEEAPLPALALYAEAWQALADGDVEGFAARHTEKSAAKIREAAGTAGWPGFVDLETRSRRVRYLIEADPFLYVFYTRDPPEGALAPSPSDVFVWMDTIFEDEEGRLFLANLNSASHLERALNETVAQSLATLEAAIGD